MNAQDRSASLRAQHVGVGDVQVVARDGDIEIVFERERNGVIERQIEFAVVHELVDSGGIGEIRRRQAPGNVRSNRIGEVRHRMGVIQDR